MDYHPVTKRITDLLSERGAPFKTFEHAPARTSEEAAALRPEYTLGQGAKAMIVRVKTNAEKFFAMLVLPADRKFDIAAVKEFFGAKDIRLATEQEVLDVTGGVQIGGVPPLGNLFGMPVVADPTLFENDEIIFNAGDRCFSVAMRSADYRIIVDPQVAAICAAA